MTVDAIPAGARVALAPPAAVLAITRTLEEAGYEAWCVGGAVRDALLGIPNLDWDLATSARPEQVRRLFRRTVPVGIEFGTVGVLDDAGVLHEVTTFRHDVETDGRHAVVRFGASLDDDLARRDFTINAIAYSPTRAELRDPFGGRADLVAGVVRAVGVPADRMREDRLRALRGIRFAARFDFDLDPATWQAIVASAPQMGRLSPERVRQEIEKTMRQAAAPSRAFERWRDAGIFAALVPALADATPVALRAVDHLPRPGLPRRPARLLNRLTALFCAARPGTVLPALRALRFSNADAGWIAGLADRWHALGAELRHTLVHAPPSDAVLRRWAAQAGRTRVAPLLRVADAVWRAERESGRRAPEAAVVAATYRRAIRVAYRDPVEVADLAVNGDDLVALGIAGRRLGEVLRALLADVVEDPTLNTRAELLRRARP